jgi:hypothetical protein
MPVVTKSPAARRKFMKRGLIVTAMLAALAAAGVVFAALLPEQAVITSSRNDRNPSADFTGTVEVLAFTRSRSGFPNRYDAFAKRGGQFPVKLNASGQAWTGGMDYPVVAYQQIAGGDSNIRFYDLETNTRATPEINTAKWEWHPSISGNVEDYHVLFGRDDISSPTQRVVLHEHPAHMDHVLSIVTSASHYLQPDQLNGMWATYTRCVPNCNVWRYDVENEAKNVLPKPATTRPRQQYAGAVTSTGAVYLVRSGPRCGERVRIVRYDEARVDPEFGTTVAALPSGFDIVFAYVREDTLGNRDVFYDRVNCNTGRFDIYKVTDPAPAP